MKKYDFLQFLGSFLASSKMSFYKVNRANGRILNRLSVVAKIVSNGLNTFRCRSIEFANLELVFSLHSKRLDWGKFCTSLVKIFKDGMFLTRPSQA